MTVDIHSPTPHDALSLQELALWRAIMAYRAEHGLAAIPLSEDLTATAGRHVLDTRENIWPEAPAHRLLHDWSDARYHGAGGSPEAMWFAPRRLGTGYGDRGYEIAAAGTGDGAAALELWKDSPAHDAILTQSGSWSGHDFNAIGIGVETRPGAGIFAGRIFYVWFGEASDAPPLIRGTALGERIAGTVFSDRLAGLGGNDIILGGRGNDAIRAGPGSDVGSGGYGHDSISGGLGNDRLVGGPGNDVGSGGYGHDTINGGLGNDRLAGGPGNDRIVGGLGLDAMSGGAGADVFVFAAGGRDRIGDFQPGADLIHLAGIDANPGLAGDQAFRFIGAAPLDGTPGQLSYRGGVAAADADGDGRAELVVTLVGAPALVGDDFLL